MTVGELRTWMEHLPDDMEIVNVGRHANVPPEWIPDGEYDEVGGTETGYFPAFSAWQLTIRDGRMAVDSP